MQNSETKYICPICKLAVKEDKRYGTLARHGFRRGPYDNSLGCKGWLTRVRDLTYVPDPSTFEGDGDCDKHPNG